MDTEKPSRISISRQRQRRLWDQSRPQCCHPHSKQASICKGCRAAWVRDGMNVWRCSMHALIDDEATPPGIRCGLMTGIADSFNRGDWLTFRSFFPSCVLIIPHDQYRAKQVTARACVLDVQIREEERSNLGSQFGIKVYFYSDITSQGFYEPIIHTG